MKPEHQLSEDQLFCRSILSRWVEGDHHQVFCATVPGSERFTLADNILTGNCPFHSNEEWQRIKQRNGADWKRVVEIDRALRRPGNVVNRKLEQQMFLHRSCRPIDEIDFTKEGDVEMAAECEGMCGS